jgi:hypothetical protein
MNIEYILGTQWHSQNCPTTPAVIWEATEIILNQNFCRELGYQLIPAQNIIHILELQWMPQHTHPTIPVSEQGTTATTS